MRISAGFLIGLAMMLLLVPFEWLMAFIFAAAFHEACHYVAIRIVTGDTAKVRLFSYSAQMTLPEMSAGREVVCALAGPIGSLLLLFFSDWIPHVAVCATLQSVYNLLPVYPLDGGRALRCCLKMIMAPDRARMTCERIEKVCVVGILGLAVYGSVWMKLGLFPLLLTLLLLIRIK